MIRRAFDVTRSLVRTFVIEIARVAKIAVPVAIVAMVVVLLIGSSFGGAVIGGLLAGLLAAAVTLSSPIDSDDGEERREPWARRRS